MKIQGTTPPLHLTYCLNIHPGESLDEILTALATKTSAVARHVAGEEPFGTGLRLSADAAKDLNNPAKTEQLLKLFEELCIYAFTINGFSYGNFHGDPVKQSVYWPDWRSTERRDYTVLLSNLLAGLLLDQVDGSISTSPCSYKPWIREEGEVIQMVTHLIECVANLVSIHETTGKEIHLGLEPEPDCFLERTDETITFFQHYLLDQGAKILSRQLKRPESTCEGLIRKHLGICFDTCHAAVEFEDPAQALRAYRDAGIRISKIQISSALDLPNTGESRERLRSFDEPIYLHQVKAMSPAGLMVSWGDLPEALSMLPLHPEIERIRVHFHVPLFWKGDGLLGSTAHCLTPEFFKLATSGITRHLEIETYTFDVLPPDLATNDVIQSIEREFEWVQDSFRPCFDTSSNQE